MSQAGNVGGGGTRGRGLPRLSDSGPAGPAGPGEERTRIGRAPQAPPTPQTPTSPPSTSSRLSQLLEDAGAGEAPRTGIFDFSQFSETGLENALEDSRKKTRESRDDKAGGFEQARDARGTGSRPRVRSRTDEDPASASFEGREAPPSRDARGTGDRPRVRSRTGEDRLPRSPDEPRDARGTGDRPRVRSRTGEDGISRAPEGQERGEAAPRGDKRAAGEAPRTRRTGEAGAFDTPAQAKTSERPALPPRAQAPRVPVGIVPPQTPALPAEPTGEVKPLEELIPMFAENIGQEALAHHFAEELSFLGPQLRPAKLPGSERMARLWAFFIAYAEASARDPSSHTAAGRERFGQVLKEQGFAQLQDANTGKDGVVVAQELLEAKSPEELQAKLSQLRMEAKPEAPPSEVHVPPQAQAEQAEQPPRTPEQAKAETPEHAAAPERKADPERKEQPPSTARAPAFDQAEREKPLMGKEPAPGMPQVTPHLQKRVERDSTFRPEDEAQGPDRRGTNKRMGSNMLWNVMHGMRDSAEDDATKREQWSQLAFGAMAFLMGAAILIAMLVSL